MVCCAVPAFAQTTFRTPREAVKYYEDLMGGLANQVRSLQDENAKLSSEMLTLKEQMRAMGQNNDQLARDLVEMKKLFAAMSEKNERQLGKIADRLKETGAVLKNNPAASGRAALPGGEFDEYVVQPGATLSAISRACGVSIDDLKRVNNLKSDVLRVGMKLKIPRK